MTKFERGVAYARAELSKGVSADVLNLQADNPFDRDDFDRGIEFATREPFRQKVPPQGSELLPSIGGLGGWAEDKSPQTTG